MSAFWRKSGGDMRYRSFGGLDWRPSALGFGAMRLPTLESGVPATESAAIDEPEATAMLHRAIEGGVNYVDTAYVYHKGASEGWLGRALAGGWRERVKVATKLPVWRCEKRVDFDRLLAEQLERLQLSSIDFYLLHGLSRERWQAVRDLGVLRWAEGQLADGSIGHFGFSFHDSIDAFREIVAATDTWEFCQIQLNYMDVDYQAGLDGLRLAAETGLGVIVMEPLRGGQLSKEPPPGIKELFIAAPNQRTYADWALQWLWSLPEVSLVLSGMSSIQQVCENLESASRSAPGSLSADELALLGRVREAYQELAQTGCTGCGYCTPCPQGVDIPGILELIDDVAMYDDLPRQRANYLWVAPENRADHCIGCRVCEERCPQHVEVVDWMQRAIDLLSPSESEPIGA